MVVIGKFPEMEMENGCGQCPKRATCTALCETAEAYASQDHTTFIGPVFLRDPLAPEPNAERANRIPLEETIADMQADIVLDEAEADILEAVDGRGRPLITDAQRECLYGFFWLGKSIREIGRERGVNPSTILKSLRGGRQALRSLIWERLAYRRAMNGESSVKVGKHFSRRKRETPIKSGPLLVLAGLCL